MTREAVVRPFAVPRVAVVGAILLALMNGPVQAAEFLVTGENRQVADGRTAWKFLVL